MKLLAATTFILLLTMTAAAGTPPTGNGDDLMKSTPICFQENRGQVVDHEGNPRTDIAFTARVAGVQLYFRQDGISYVFSKTDEQASPQNGATHSLRKRAKLEEPTPVRMQLQRMDMTLAGCNPAARIRAYDAVPGVVNYYLAHCPQGITGVREYRRIVYKDIYEHIDLELLTMDGKVKYNFIVRPGGDPRTIRMQYDGASETAIRHDGSLAVGTALGGIEEQAPYTYCGSENNAVASRFVRDGSTLRFDVAEYDATQTLVIDPWATYYGGSDEDNSMAITTDADGNVVVVGYSGSADFPVTSGAHQMTKDFSCDAFIVKFSSSGSRLWATYYGGNSYDFAHDVCTDGNDQIAICGGSASTNLPVSPGLISMGNNAGSDAYIAKFSANGSLIWATYVGGRSGDEAKGITADQNGNFYVAGSTSSRKFPTTSGAYMTSLANGFLLKLAANGSLVWSTFLWDHAQDVAIDASGNLFVLGRVMSAAVALPTTASSFQQQFGGGNDVYAAKFTGAGGLLWVTYCGGSGGESPGKVCTDPLGNAIISGCTTSNDFPVTSGAYQTTYGGYDDGFLIKLDANGGGAWASYIGGSQYDVEARCASDASGNIVVAILGNSTNLPVSSGAVQPTNRGGGDWYIAKFSATCLPMWSTYYGGTGDEFGGARHADVAISGNGYVHMAGSTQSIDIPTVSACQSSFAGGYSDAFILQLDAAGGITLPNRPPVAVASANPTSGTVPLTVQFTGSNSSDPENGPLTYHWDFGDNSSSTLADPSHTYATPGTYSVILTVTDDASNSSTAFVTIDATAASSGVMYIAEMYTERVPQPGNKELCRCRVRIKDGNGDPMHNVYVEISWTGPNSNYWYGITGPNGWCGVETAKERDPVGLWTFYIDDVYEPGYTYDASLNAVSLPFTEPTPKSVAGQRPERVRLHQNFPNPFNPTTTISYAVPAAGRVLLRVFDLLGREQALLVDEEKDAGEFRVLFDGSTLPSGPYVYQLEYNGTVLTRKMTMLK